MYSAPQNYVSYPPLQKGTATEKKMEVSGWGPLGYYSANVHSPSFYCEQSMYICSSVAGLGHGRTLTTKM